MKPLFFTAIIIRPHEFGHSYWGIVGGELARFGYPRH